jgi:hypothetical protein
MNKLLLIVTFLSSLPALQGQTFVDKTLVVGDTAVTLPVPTQYVQLERNMPIMKDFFINREHAFKDESKNNTFILASITPEKFSEAGRSGKLTDSLDCWVVSPNFSSHSRVTVAQFSRTVRDMEVSFKSLSNDAKLIDAFKIKVTGLNNELLRKNMESIEKPQIISKSERTLVIMAKNGGEYILSAYCLINGKFLILYVKKQNPFDAIEEMDAWTKEIEKKTTAEFGYEWGKLDSNWRTAAIVAGLLIMIGMAAAALVFAFKSKPPTT